VVKSYPNWKLEAVGGEREAGEDWKRLGGCLLGKGISASGCHSYFNLRRRQSATSHA